MAMLIEPASTLDGRHIHHGGRFRAASGTRTIAVRSPATGEAFGSVPLGDAADVSAAVGAAEAAAGPWASSTRSIAADTCASWPTS